MYTDGETQKAWLYNPLMPKPALVEAADPQTDYKLELDSESVDHLLQFKASEKLAMVEIKRHELFQDFRSKEEAEYYINNRGTFEQFAQNENVPKVLVTHK